MKGLIDVNTDTILSLVSSAEVANDNINEAAERLLSITQHYDWNCKERDTINEYTVENAQMIKHLQEKSDHFLKAIRTVADSLLQEEKNISNIFEEVEHLLSNIGAIQLGESVSNVVTQMPDIASQIINKSKSELNSTSLTSEGIKVWRLSDTDI